MYFCLLFYSLDFKNISFSRDLQLLKKIKVPNQPFSNLLKFSHDILLLPEGRELNMTEAGFALYGRSCAGQSADCLLPRSVLL